MMEEGVSNKINKTYITKIDKNDEIIYINNHWKSFARENDASDLISKSIMGQSIWKFVCDHETIFIYQTLITKARETGLLYRVPFRCDSPNCRRFMEIEIIPLEDGNVGLRSYVVKTEFRDHVRLLDSTVPRSDNFIRMCSYCKKVFVSNSGWFEVEEAIRILDLFAVSELPKITHGICPECYERIEKELRKLKDQK